MSCCGELSIRIILHVGPSTELTQLQHACICAYPGIAMHILIIKYVAADS